MGESLHAQASDPARREAEQRQQWDSVAAGWRKWWRTIESGAEQVSIRMMDLADVKPGQRVLDIATGIGEPALLAGSRVGASGRVVATDISSSMLAIARERAKAQGIMNVEFRESDAERMDFPDGSFDIILCRWGVPSFAHPLSVLSTIRRMLSPAGSFATSVWKAGPTGRPLASLAMALGQEMFALASPGPGAPPSPETEASLETQMMHAGFTDMRLEEVTMTLEFPSAADSIEYLTDVSPDVAALLSEQSPGQQAEYRKRLANRLQPYVTGDGSVRIPNLAVCAAGRR